ncbi:Titin [Talaromyces islandicus]|uniref:Titin n=1 Tax=Talaromyces islandicus TaxID=28573 RepID=A0A0U1M2L1_TALIS|nr:Titin [Talaromyces islandicus]
MAENSSEDVNDFLLRIRELGDKRDREDEERTRKLEEEILQGRKERQARRAERARSISPTKDSPLASALDIQRSAHESILHPPQDLKPSADTALQNPPSPSQPESEELANSSFPQKPASSALPNLDTDAPAEEEPSAHTRSELNDPAENSGDAMMPTEDDTATPSRAQISRALGSKDPSWFRQTADRERSSLALRKDAEESSFPEIPSVGSSFKLPGLSRNSTPEPDKPHEIAGVRSRSPSRASSTVATSSVGYRYSSISSVSTSGLGSPVPLSSQRLDSRKPDPQPNLDERTPLSPGRGSPERPGSPTKGLGGFVQSAMMKRSDSISKRWSVQAPGSLSRSNSVISNRSSVSRSGFGDALQNPVDPRAARGTSPLTLSRPGSSHSEATVVNHPAGDETNTIANKVRTDNGFVKPSLPTHSRSNTISSVGSTADETKGGDPTTPRSPSKTMDPKRWSPTKASWLESALNRPESPRAKNPPVTQQPPWLRDLSKARQSRGSVDLGKPTALKEAAPVGLARSSQVPEQDQASSISTVPETTATTLVPKETKEDGLDTKTEGPKPSSEETPVESQAASEPSQQSAPSISKVSPPVPSNKPKLPPPNDTVSQSTKPAPGVIDFRSNLRRREASQDNSVQSEPEFKNVFGKLRKTERSNYKAPDVFKDNIMKGKAALNVTGGPKKSDRVDEFKESILKRKEEMKAGGGSIRRPSEDERIPPKPRDSIPEALSKRNNLSRTDSTKSSVSSLSSPVKSPETGSPTKAATEVASIVETAKDPSPKPVAPTPPVSFSEDSKTTPEPPKKLPEPDVAVKAPEPQQGEDNEAVQPVRPSQSKVFVGATMPFAAPKGPVAKGTIADRLNPALANILSRGPPREGGETNKSLSLDQPSVPTAPKEREPGPAAPLTHMTKGRARGPKRRLPAASKSAPVQSVTKEEVPTPKQSPTKKTTTPKPEKTELKISQDRFYSSPTIANKIESSPALPQTPDKPLVNRQKPLIASKSPELQKSLISSRVDQSATPKAQEKSEEKPSEEKPSPRLSKSYSSPEVPPKSGIVRQKVDIEKSRSLDERPTPPPKSNTLPLAPSAGNSSPSPSFASRLKETWANSAASPLQTKFGLGLSGSLFPSRPESPLEKTSPQPDKVSVPPPVPSKQGLRISSNLGDKTRRQSVTSPVPQTTESGNVISQFFGTPPKSSDRVDIDPQLILTAETDCPKTRTIRKQIWEITGDGKKQDLPVNQEYILFEGSMYVCVHNFEYEGGTRTEAYLWLGDEVSEAAMEDAQLFARRVARENGARLELVRQGKEPATFIEALGGIIITRRGSSSRSSSSALYMLCGRRHLGQIAFDEVDLSRRNLCSGFPFVISAKFGKLYLWKGKGSGADEIGSARLIGMDLGLTGEIEEIVEGEEPTSFFEVFPDGKDVQPRSSTGHWHMKSKHDKYRSRLLRVDHILGQKGGFWNRRGSSSPVTRPNDTVEEIEPFCQKDLRPRDIYVLDAFFEIYVVVGNEAQSKAAEFASALVFAHEYGILAASLEDRPFIPKSFVVFGGIPEQCRVAFRKWDSKIWQSTARILPLNAAIEAIRS